MLVTDGFSMTSSATVSPVPAWSVPASRRGWPVGDKSGSASYGTRNDIAIVRPPGRAPWVVVIMTSHKDADAPTDDDLVAQAASIVADTFTA